jgi:hypothetical protein
MARYVRMGGVLIIEPWFTPEQWRPAKTSILTGEIGADKVYRISRSIKKGQMSILLHDYLRATPTGVTYNSESIELGLFTRDEMIWAFEFAGVKVRYDAKGLMGRGLYVGKHDPEMHSG